MVDVLSEAVIRGWGKVWGNPSNLSRVNLTSGSGNRLRPSRIMEAHPAPEKIDGDSMSGDKDRCSRAPAQRGHTWSAALKYLNLQSGLTGVG